MPALCGSPRRPSALAQAAQRFTLALPTALLVYSSCATSMPVIGRYGLVARSFSVRRVHHSIVLASPNVKGTQYMLTNTTVEDEVRDAVQLDPRIPDDGEIALSAEEGTVTLRGTVGSFSQRRAAVKDARGVDGVDDVVDELQVRLLNDDRREDADIRGAALQFLMWDIEVPSESIDVKVNDGWATLKGDVSYQFESDAAFDDVACLYGVVGITNEIEVITP